MPALPGERTVVGPPQPALRISDIQANVLFLTACRANETAMDGEFNGAFTGALLAALELQPTSWQHWFTTARSMLSEDFPTQHPQMRNVRGKIYAETLTA